jgi:hypothetical protein
VRRRRRRARVTQSFLCCPFCMAYCGNLVGNFVGNFVGNLVGNCGNLETDMCRSLEIQSIDLVLICPRRPLSVYSMDPSSR